MLIMMKYIILFFAINVEEDIHLIVAVKYIIDRFNKN